MVSVDFSAGMKKVGQLQRREGKMRSMASKEGVRICALALFIGKSSKESRAPRVKEGERAASAPAGLLAFQDTQIDLFSTGGISFIFNMKCEK